MKAMIRRAAAALLALTLVWGLAGCGKGAKTVDQVFQTSLYYVQEGIPTAAETGVLVDCCTDRQSIWYLSIPEENAAPVLCRVPLDGTAAAVLPEYQPPVEEGTPAGACWGPVLGGDGTLWIWEEFVIRPDDGPEAGGAGAYRMVSRMRQFDPDTGKELSAMDISAAMEEMDRMSLGGLAVDGAGTIFLADKDHIAAIGGQGQILYTLKAALPNALSSGGAGGTLALLPDGTVGALVVRPGDEREVRPIDPETGDWTGKKFGIHKQVSQIYSGSGACAFYYISSSVLYGVVPGDEVPLRLLSWAGAQVDSPSSVRCFALLEEGQAVIFTDMHAPGTGQYDGLLQVTRLLPTKEPPAGGRVKLVYGTIGTNELIRQRIIQFNRTSKTYQIMIRDYSEGMMYWGEKNNLVYQNALSRLYAEISAGRGPDILDSSIPLEGLSRQGALENLWPWIDADPDISRETLMDHVLECMEVDGELTRVCSGFAIETAVASAEAAGGRTGWTMEEMLEAFGGMPEFYFGGMDDRSIVHALFNRFDKRSTLYYLVSRNLDRYVNWGTGECAFDGEDFKSLLRIVGSGKDAESIVNLDANLALLEWDLPGKVEAAEPCQVFPWENKPVLYMRTLAEPKDLVIDDALFGGREPLTDYVQRLWDAGLLYHEAFDNGVERDFTLYETDLNQRDWWNNGFTAVRTKLQGTNRGTVAADCVTGAADGKIYAAYVGLPAASGTGSSFSLYDCMGISAASREKEGGWSFVRSLLLPNGNMVGLENLGNAAVPPVVNGFSINRTTFEERTAQRYWTDPYSGEVFLDGNGDPVEFSAEAVALGIPGDIVLMAYLFSPTEAQMDRFWNLYNAIDHITGSDDALLNLILEQADAYFAGDKSLEETAALIQNRAKLYVSEQG